MKSKFPDLDARAADELSDMSFRRYKIEAARLSREMTEDEARPILTTWIRQWGERDKRLSRINEYDLACMQRKSGKM